MATTIEAFWANNSSIIIPIIASLLTALVTALITHNLDKSKLKYNVKMEIISNLTREKYEGIALIRKAILKLNQYEDLSITEEDILPELQNDSLKTPAVCYSIDTIADYAQKLNDLLGDYGHCLEHKCYLRICILRNFFIDLIKTCKTHGIDDELIRWICVPLYEEFSKECKELDNELIGFMNKPTLKYTSHSGKKYQRLLEKEEENYYSSSVYSKSFGRESILLRLLAEIENKDGDLNNNSNQSF